jgi:hypothetical protein
MESWFTVGAGAGAGAGGGAGGGFLEQAAITAVSTIVVATRILAIDFLLAVES